MIFLTCSDMSSTALFYVLVTTKRESLRLMRYSDRQYIGNFSIPIEPVPSGKIHAVQILDTRTLLVPINLVVNNIVQNLNMCITLKDGEQVQSFLFETSSIVFKRAHVEKSCNGVQCDSQRSLGPRVP